MKLASIPPQVSEAFVRWVWFCIRAFIANALVWPTMWVGWALWFHIRIKDVPRHIVR